MKLKAESNLISRVLESGARLRWVVSGMVLVLYFPLMLGLHYIIGNVALAPIYIPGLVWAILLSPRLAMVGIILLLIPNYFILHGLYPSRTVAEDARLLIFHLFVSSVSYIVGYGYVLRRALVRELAERKTSDIKFRGLFESTRDAVLVADLDLVIRDANDEALRMLGYTRVELIGKPFIDIVPAEEHGEMQARAKQAVAGVRLPIYERTYLRKNGSKIVAEDSSALIRNTDGSPSHFQTIARDVTKRKAAEQELYFLATHDRLTGLYNKAMAVELLNRAIERARRNKSQLAVLFADLDKFKWVNDNLGHNVGDILLKECAKRLTDLLRKSDIIARIGGDEFVVVLEPIEEKKYGAQVAKNIQAALGAPFMLEGKRVYIACSIGISYFPDDGEDPETLLGKSDQVMYAVKHEKKRDDN